MREIHKCPKCYSYYDTNDVSAVGAHQKDPCDFIMGETFGSARRRYWTLCPESVPYVVGRMNSDDRKYIEVVDVRAAGSLAILVFDGANEALERDIVEVVRFGGGRIYTDLDLSKQTDKIKSGVQNV